jgi:hypothetical protein
LRAQIGIADTGREVQIEVDGREELADYLASAYRDGTPVLWFKTAKGADIGVPLDKLAFVEIVDAPDQAIGFGR